MVAATRLTRAAGTAVGPSQSRAALQATSGSRFMLHLAYARFCYTRSLRRSNREPLAEDAHGYITSGLEGEKTS
jgi:hypothetical protein